MNEVEALTAEYRMSQTEDRRKDTQRKIQLGGLVVKAGLADADPAFILGVLLTGAESRGEATFAQFMRDKGAAAFKGAPSKRVDYSKTL